MFFLTCRIITFQLIFYIVCGKFDILNYHGSITFMFGIGRKNTFINILNFCPIYLYDGLFCTFRPIFRILSIIEGNFAFWKKFVRTNRFRKARIIFSQLQSTLKLPLVLKRIQFFFLSILGLWMTSFFSGTFGEIFVFPFSPFSLFISSFNDWFSFLSSSIICDCDSMTLSKRVIKFLMESWLLKSICSTFRFFISLGIIATINMLTINVS